MAASPGIAGPCLRRRRRDLADRGLKPGATSQESAELAEARQRIRDLEEEVKILRKAAAAVEAVVPPKDRYRLAAELHAEGVRVRRACHAPGVSRPGFCAWAGRAPSPRAIRHAWLTGLTGTIHQASRGTYGAPRVHAELVYGHGITIGHNTVSLLMRRAGLAGLPARSCGKRTKKLATVTGLARRESGRSGPGQLQVTGIPGRTAREGTVYCCAVLDAWSRRVAGQAIGSCQRADLAASALGMATGSRTPAAGGIIHGGHGTQFTSWTFTERARKAGLLPSLGTTGDPCGNAIAESFWARMQTGLLNRQRWDTRAGLANAISGYIEGICNRRRRHSAPGWQTPVESGSTAISRTLAPQTAVQVTGS